LGLELTNQIILSRFVEIFGLKKSYSLLKFDFSVKYKALATGLNQINERAADELH